MSEELFSELASAVQTIKGVEDGSIDPNTITLPDENTEEVSENPPVPNESETEGEEAPKQTEPKTEEVNEEPKDDKKVQTPEENAKFAEQRRQQELEKRVQEELDKRLAESPEMKAAKMLKDQYGMEPSQLLEMMEYQRLQEQSQQTGIPLDYLQQQAQQQRQQSQLELQLQQMQLKLWETETAVESQKLMSEFPVLNDQDIQEARDYLLNTLKTTSVPLRQAVMAVHSEKILNSLKESATQEVLAEKSGRKTPLPQQGGKTPSTPVLNDEQKWAAKIFGMSDEDYLKYSTNN